jgi:hypothetical protein
MPDLKQRYLILEQGKTLRQWFTIKNPLTGAIYDLEDEGYVSAVLQIRDAIFSEDGQLILELTTENGGVVFEYDAMLGSGYIYASDEDTDLPLFSDAQFEFVAIHEGGNVDTISRGPSMLIPKVVDL